MSIRTTALAATLAAVPALTPALAQQDPEQEGSDAAKEQFFATLTSAGDFSTLEQVLQGSDATWFLEEGEAYTLFAPTDEAFAELPNGVLDALMTEENRPKLNAILERHLVPDGALMAADLSGRDALDPATGEPLEVSSEGDGVMVGEATVTQPDIETENGVVHAIDTVLVPEIVIEAMKYREEWPETEEGETAD